MNMQPHVLVIGNGMVGQYLVEALADSAYQITVLAEEPRPAYDRVHLSEYFAGRTAEDLSLVEDGFFERNDIALHLNDPVCAIDRERCEVTTQSGAVYGYDTLVLATGSSPFVPPVPGHDAEHCQVYRTIEDLEAIRASASVSRSGVVIGGGLLGLECANALLQLDLKTEVVELAPRLMAVQLDEAGGALLRDKIEALGIGVHVGRCTESIEAGESARYRLCFADGANLETDMVVFSAGIRPRDQLARQCGLEVGPRGGVVIDDQCRTSDPKIFAIGECALWSGQIFGLVAPGYQMARVAVDALLESESASRFEGADMSTKLKLLGVDVASIGDAQARTPGARRYAWSDEVAGSYRALVVSEDGKQLLGAVLVGDVQGYDAMLQYKLNGIALPDQPEALILPALDGVAPTLGLDALPDSASICSCHNVSKGALVAAVEAGARTVKDLKGDTQAGTGCGGCVPLLKQLLDAELTRLGLEVNNHLCEHFAYSRQELYHIVRVNGIRDFDTLLRQYGQGRGCDICKPAVASILASCWNDYVLESPHQTLQDTNDRFLANLQRNGTYSIVPRVPGGEITPEQLIAIGEVAREFDLYTKITGGQRIDLFGAQLHQLPLIWQRLIDAGLESGHAYAKALRTVKSCVGSTWCRYGVQDSVGMAIAIEQRYKGLRAPHKIKMAVSGCTRECAEAQSKDVGVIATERGWNLYVCGNGGMKPRHADLLATDLDDHTLIRYIDRFLMFYIRTADRLQRTAGWLEGLEGSLDYLRAVVCDDSLGLADELEAQMQHVVDTFQCEWATTLASEEKRATFRHFVNSDATDPNLHFIRERGQRRPALPQEIHWVERKVEEVAE